MNRQILQGFGILVIMQAYYLWRFGMIGFDVPFFLPVVGFGVVFPLGYMYYFRKTDGKRKKLANTVFYLVAVMYLAAVLIRLVFLS